MVAMTAYVVSVLFQISCIGSMFCIYATLNLLKKYHVSIEGKTRVSPSINVILGCVRCLLRSRKVYFLGTSCLELLQGCSYRP